MSTEQQKENIEFALALMSRKLDSQGKSHVSLETKIGILLGFVGIIAAGAVTLMQGQMELVGRNFLTLGLIGLAVTLFLLILASRTQIFFDPPDFPAFYSKEALSTDSLEVKNQVIADMKESYNINLKNQIRKAKLYDVSLWVFLGSLILIFIGIL